MKKLVTLLYSTLAGICIALGGTAFLSVDNKVTGAIFFSLGLFIILTNGFLLFTGRALYIFERPLPYLIDLGIIWIGNLIGTSLVALIERATRLDAVVERARAVVDIRLGDSLLSIFLLGVLCNILIFVAVDGFNNNKHEIGKYLALLFGVAGFIICGFEHCVANMYFIGVAGAWSLHTLVVLLVTTAGNVVGGVIVPLCRMVKVKAGE